MVRSAQGGGSAQGSGPASGERALAEFGYTQELKRSLGMKDLLIYGLVFMVPTAPFAIYGSVFNESKGMVALTYAIGCVAMIFTAFSYRSMSRAFPVAGSVYAYAGRGLGAPAGFLAGWAILLDYLLIPTLLYVTGAAALGSVVPGVPQWVWVVIFVAVNTVVNLAGIKLFAMANTVFLIGEALVLALFIVLGVIAVARGVNGAHWSWDPLYNPDQFHVSFVFGAISVAALSFLGFDAISTLAEEVKGGSKMVGRATVLSLLMVAGLFVVQTFLAGLLLPGKTHFAGDTATNDAFYTVARLVGGTWFKVVVALTVALSAALANSLAAQAATSRLLFSMARDGQLPKFLAHVDPRRKVPQRAVLLVGAVSLILGVFFVGQVGLLSSLVNFGALFSFLMLHVTVGVYYLVKKRQRTYGVHLAVPLIGFAIIAYVLWNADAKAQIGGLIWLAIGVVVVLVRKFTGRPVELTQPQ
ncbi:APC family permease [Streptomyces montanisoli]|uniref:APC family permease n=1 Tax=Streptomyces montanisoli TaxID=2798581 RepID=A0A940RUE4_9ACTN|nr:APC family permease [Streptomyces montanisoli]MBP0457146.1 APC family permease [Streptomyces montanisoli]